MPYRIKRSESAEAGVRRIASEQIERALNEIADAHVPVGESIHQVRKRCKKVRGLLRLVRASIGGTYSDENAWFRDTARLLAPFRDADVVLGTYDSLLNAYEDEIDKAALAPVRARLTRSRRQVYEEGDGAGDRLTEAAERLHTAAARVDAWSLADTGFEVCAGGLEKTYSRARRALGAVRAADQPEPQATHEWRKRVKYHWYHLRLLRRTWPEIMRPFVRASHDLSTLLGEEHDLAVLRSILVDDLSDKADHERLEVLMGLIEQRRRSLLAAAIPLGVRLFALEPGAIVQQTRAYWEAWQSPAEPPGARWHE
jgi:CHAD domain-containing protein